jgi:hypothetical protein
MSFVTELSIHVMRGDRLLARAKSNGRLRPLLRLARTFTRAVPGGSGLPEDRAYVIVGAHDVRLTFIRVVPGWALSQRDTVIWGRDRNQGSAL